MYLRLLMILILSNGLLVQTKTFDDAAEEFFEVFQKIGTGTCSTMKFESLLTASKTCAKNMESQLTFSHHCNALERMMDCYNNFAECYTPEKLKMFKAAALEAGVQLIGSFDDEKEDMFQDCPIYTEIVGMRHSTKMMYVGIAVGVTIVVIGVVLFVIYKRSQRPRYDQAAMA